MDKRIKVFSDKNVSIIINNKEYQIPTGFLACDVEQYVKEPVKENDYKKSLATIIHDRIQIARYDETPTLQDIIDTEDEVFNAFIFAVISDNKELEKIYEDIDNNLPIIEKFVIAYKRYMDNIIQRLTDLMSSFAQKLSHENRNVDFDRLISIVADFENRLSSFKHIADSITNTISKIKIPTISEEEKKRWEKSHIEWGKIGWPICPNAPIHFYNRFPKDVKTANEMVMKYCGTEEMEDLFEKMHSQKINIDDLDSAIFCYKHKQYKACALLIFGLLDSRVIRLQPSNTRRSVGYRGIKKLEKNINARLEDEGFLYTSLCCTNLVSCLYTYFEDGKNFVFEPEVINRNFVDHGMNNRTVRKRDCIQLFIALHNMEMLIDYII